MLLYAYYFILIFRQIYSWFLPDAPNKTAAI